MTRNAGVALRGAARGVGCMAWRSMGVGWPGAARRGAGREVVVRRDEVVGWRGEGLGGAARRGKGFGGAAR